MVQQSDTAILCVGLMICDSCLVPHLRYFFGNLVSQDFQSTLIIAISAINQPFYDRINQKIPNNQNKQWPQQ